MKWRTTYSRPFLYFLAIAYTRVSWGKVRILFVETRKRKCRQKCRPNETSQPTTIQPTKPTNQSKNKNFVGPGWGAKNLLKRRQVRKPFSSRPNLSCVRPSAGFSGGYLHRVLQRKNWVEKKNCVRTF
jgi:hypothetical protein